MLPWPLLQDRCVPFVPPRSAGPAPATV